MDLDDMGKRIDGRFDSWELFGLKERTKKFESRDGELYGVDVSEEEGAALRGIRGGRMVFSYTYDSGQKGADMLLENATIVTPFVEEDSDRVIPAPQGTYRTLTLYDEEGLAVDDRQKTALLVAMEKKIRGFDPRIATTRNCQLEESAVHIAILNSNGLRAGSSKTVYTLVGMAVAEEGDEVSWYDWTWSHRLSDLDGDLLAGTIASKAVSFLGSKEIETGLYPGILTPQAASDLLGVLSPSFLAESLFKGKTKLKESAGTKCFSGSLTIMDSGIQGMSSFPFDGEGTPSQETVVVDQGVFQTFLYDSYYGKKLGRPSTGNASRSGLREGPHNDHRGLFIRPGGEDVLKGFSDGVVIEELMGTHTANEITGDFSLGAIGYLCKGGTRVPFKGVILSGNVFDLLNSVEAVGNDLRFYGSTGSPSIYLGSLKISGT